MKVICKKIPKTLLFLGLAGSGKDTQADILCNLCDGAKISTGLLARAEIKKGTELGKIANQYVPKGLLIPDDIINKILRSGLKDFGSKKRWVFTGVVRTINQIPMFDETLEFFGRTLDKVICLELSDESIINRLSKRRFCPKCGTTYHPDFKKSKKEGFCDIDGEKLIQREDDKPELIRARIREERDVIGDVLKEFENRGLLLRVDGEPLVEEVHEELMERLVNEG